METPNGSRSLGFFIACFQNRDAVSLSIIRNCAISLKLPVNFLCFAHSATSGAGERSTLTVKFWHN